MVSVKQLVWLLFVVLAVNETTIIISNSSTSMYNPIPLPEDGTYYTPAFRGSLPLVIPFNPHHQG